MSRYWEPTRKRDESISDQEIVDAINSVTVREESDRVFIFFVYAGLERRILVKNRKLMYVQPHGHKAYIVARTVLTHVLSFPQDYLPQEVILRVLIGND